MASLDVLCFNPFSLKNKIMKIENISWPINICVKYFMTPTKSIRPLAPPTYLMYGPSYCFKFHNFLNLSP